MLGLTKILAFFQYFWLEDITSIKHIDLKGIDIKLAFRYDQTLFEDENRNRMMETKELFEWVLKQPCFEVNFL